ncbi:hypothetical protein [Rhizobium sp. CG5]|uniref:hypothetical protein n=1 Tax=Rhizobium sp. CG5 TaxID=2726076 RepID=UPI00203462FA|nr:hypothetical protein [Rhizobium sp. CG5]
MQPRDAVFVLMTTIQPLNGFNEAISTLKIDAAAQKQSHPQYVRQIAKNNHGGYKRSVRKKSRRVVAPRK